MIPALLMAILAQVPSPQGPTTPPTITKEELLTQQKGDLNPFPGVSRKLLIKASNAQDLAPTRALDRAWAYYTKFRGSWMPNAPKPSPLEVQMFDSFAEEEKAKALPEWITKPSADTKEGIRKLELKTEDPPFLAVKQTAETQAVKTLCIILMTEHELDRPGVARKAAQYLFLLLEKTPFDPAARMLFAKMALDAKDFNYAWYNVRIGLYLTPEPSSNDLEFMCFVGGFAAKNQWSDIQSAIRELAPSLEIANQVINKQAILFSEKASPSFTPPKK